MKILLYDLGMLQIKGIQNLIGSLCKKHFH